jgi:hypothetical protein
MDDNLRLEIGHYTPNSLCISDVCIDPLQRAILDVAEAIIARP